MTLIFHLSTKLKMTSSLKEKWKELCESGQAIDFKKGQILFYEGHQPYGIFVLRSGELVFTQSGNPCPNEHFWNSQQGKAVGIKTFLRGLAHSCTCTALTDCRTLFISKTQLMPFLKKGGRYV